MNIYAWQRGQALIVKTQHYRAHRVTEDGKLLGIFEVPEPEGWWQKLVHYIALVFDLTPPAGFHVLISKFGQKPERYGPYPTMNMAMDAADFAARPRQWN